MSKRPRSRQPLFCAVCCRSYSSKFNLQRHVMMYSHDVVQVVPEEVKAILPADLNFTIAVYNRTNSDKYFLKIQTEDLASGERVTDFVKKFGNINNCVYVLRNSNKKHSLYRGLYKCQHAPCQKENLHIRYSKTTNCKSSISATISKDLDRYFCTISINFDHNHSLTSAEVLRSRRPDANVVLVFEKMFDRGLSPIEALTSYKNHVRLQSNDVDSTHLAGRNQVPDYDWVRHTFNKLFAKKYGSFEGVEVVRDLEAFVAKADPSTCVLKFMDAETKSEFVVAVLTPLMKRMLEIQISGEVVFVDATGSVEIFGLKVFVVIVKTDVGGMPGGVVITTNERAHGIEEGFRLLTSLTDQFSFGGRGTLGPSTIMTDDNATEVAALQRCFPNAKCFLCVIHFLRSTYRWLSHSENGVDVETRKIIYARIKGMVHASTDAILAREYKRLAEDFGANAKLEKYLKRLYGSRQKWATCYRGNVPPKGSNIYATLEQQMRISKEQIFNRVRGRAPAQLVDFLLNSLDECFKMKLIDVSLGTLNSAYWYADDDGEQECDDYCFTQDKRTACFYDALNKKNRSRYLINADAGVCSCYVGVDGMFCKHQRLLSVFTESGHSSQLFVSTDAKLYLYYLATGSRDLSTDLADSLKPAIVADERFDGSEFDTPMADVMSEDCFVDAGASEGESKCDDALSATVVSTELGAALKELTENFRVFVELARADGTRGCLNGVKTFNRELKRLNTSTADARLAALHSFNRNVGFMPRKKTRWLKNVGRWSTALRQTTDASESCNDHDYND